MQNIVVQNWIAFHRFLWIKVLHRSTIGEIELWVFLRGILPCNEIVEVENEIVHAAPLIYSPPVYIVEVMSRLALLVIHNIFECCLLLREVDIQHKTAGQIVQLVPQE